MYWPEGHNIAYGCGFCNPHHYDSVLNERETVPINVAHKLYLSDQSEVGREAFGEALLKYVYGVIGKASTDEETTDDLAQNALLEIWKELPNFKGQSQFSTWIASIANFTTADSVARTQALREVILLTEIGRKEKAIRGIEAKLTLKALVGKLDSEDRQLVQMKLDGLTDEEIAEAFNMKPRGVETRWRRIKKDMQQVETKWVSTEDPSVELTDIKAVQPGLRSARTLEGRTVYLSPDQIKQVKVH